MPKQIRPLSEAAFREVEREPGPYAVLSQDIDMRVLVQCGGSHIRITDRQIWQTQRIAVDRKGGFTTIHR